MYSQTSCSGLIRTSTGMASWVNSLRVFMYSAERIRPILVGVW